MNRVCMLVLLLWIGSGCTAVSSTPTTVAISLPTKATAALTPTREAPAAPKVTQLTDSGARNGQASWSPDGQQIAFVSNRSGSWEVWTMAADGSQVQQITQNVGPAGWPTWTPNGRSLLFYAPGSSGYQLFSVDLETLAVTPWQENDDDDFRPLLDVDGNRLLFDRVKPGAANHDIYMLDQQNGELTQLTSDPAYDSDARWSPDGERIVFHSDRGQEAYYTQIYLLDLAEKNLTQLTDGLAVNGYPSWSPDGAQIVYTEERDGNRDLWLMDADGGNKMRLTTHEGFDGDPAFRPDGMAILFTTDRFGHEELALLLLP